MKARLRTDPKQRESWLLATGNVMTDGDTVRMNESLSIEDHAGLTPDDENAPPLSPFFTGWKAWLTFAVWPIIFCVVNGVVFGTLIVFDEYAFRGRRGSTDPYSEYPDNTRLNMLRFNATVFMVMLFLDATLLYLAARTVEKEVEALDDLNVIADNDGTQATTGASNPLILSDNRHVHGQVSRKLDAILGRGPRPHGSIVVSLLFLACVISAALGVSSVAEWCFTRTLIAHDVCESRFPTYRERDHTISDTPIEGIPDKLQTWAKGGGDSWNRHQIVQLKDKTTYLINKDPRAPRRNEGRKYDEEESEARANYDIIQNHGDILIAVYTDGTVKSFPNVVQPLLVVWPSETGADDPLSTRGFCSLYYSMYTPFWSLTGRSNPESKVSLLCVDSSDTATMQSRGEFRNVTLAEQSDGHFSLNWYADCVWIMHVYDSDPGVSITAFHKATVVEGQPLRLVPVSNITEKLVVRHGAGGGFFAQCSSIRKLVFWLAFSLSSLAAWAWLQWIRNLVVAIVPLYIAAFVAVALIDNPDLHLAFPILLSLFAFITLQGNGMPSQTVQKREKLVWLLYIGLGFSVLLTAERIDEFCLFAFLGCCVAGTILGHPALYLAGWMGGIGSVLVGIFFIFINEHVWGMTAISLGIFGGPGCVTVGLFLIKYRSYLSYYAKRAWKSVTTFMLTAGLDQPGEEVLTDNRLYRDS